MGAQQDAFLSLAGGGMDGSPTHDGISSLRRRTALLFATNGERPLLGLTHRLTHGRCIQPSSRGQSGVRGTASSNY
jgi:hypothetical protein